MNKRKIVFFERWADPIAEEVLAKEPWIELVRHRANKLGRIDGLH